MASCPACGSTMAHFENPSRDICPTPERHEAAKGRMREGGRQTGEANKGKPKKDNLPGGAGGNKGGKRQGKK